MKKTHGILLLLLLLVGNLVFAQQPFSIINDIPHLALRDPASITSPETGMLIYSSIDDEPLIYTGSVWETLCITKIGNITAEDYFTVKGGISYLPVLKNHPANNNKLGTIYYSSVNRSTMINNGSNWIKIRDIGSSTFMESKGFSAGVDVKTFKLPVMQNNPSIVGLTKGAFYINALSRSIRYYNGSNWKDLKCIDLPSIITLPVNGITAMTALSGGDITDDGGSPVTARGIRWSVEGDPIDDPSATMTNDGSGVGVFPSSIVGLLGNTTYYVRAYAVNSQGTVYGNLIQFTTAAPGLPVLSFATVNITDITEKSAQGALNILSNGGAVITDRGFAWSTDRVNWVYGPSTMVNKSDVGIFISNLVDLLPATTYYTKGYATNSVGTIFTSETSFVTSSAPFIATIKPTNITGIDAFSGGQISNNGGSKVTVRGICWSTEELPTIDLPTKTEEPISGDGVGNFSSMLSGLIPGVKYYVRAYAVNDAGLTYGKQETFTTLNYATVTTFSAAAFFNNTTTGGGQVLADGGAAVTSRGVCWGLNENPTISDSYIINGSGLGVFNSSLTNLLPNVTYHMRAWAANSVGTAYGADKTFIIIPELPSVITLAPIAITNISATAGGEVADNGRADIISRGVRWSIKGDPIDDASAITTNDGTAVGTYQSLMSSLMGNTTYYIRAYATNLHGIAYGELLEFKTLAPQIPILASPNLVITNITYTEASGSVNISSNGGATVVSRGLLYSTDRVTYMTQESFTQNPTDVGVFVSNLKGLLPGTTYYAKAFATNSAGTAYTKEISFTTPLHLSLITSPVSKVTNNSAESGGHIVGSGLSGILYIGICWSTSPNPTIADDYISGSVSDTFTSEIAGLQGGTKYYVRAYAGDNLTIVYGNEESFVTAASSLAIETIKPTKITGTDALSGGQINNNGGSAIILRGICWSTEALPTIDLSTKTEELVSGDGLGTFSSVLSGLSPGVKYYVRAYAVNDAGLVYGKQETFSTPNYATVTTFSAASFFENTAKAGGQVLTDGGVVVTARGVCWSLNENPTVNDSYVISGAGLGVFSSLLANLSPNVTYHMRAYATNSVGTAYGADKTFVILSDLPSVITLSPIAVTNVSATAGGQVTNDGGTDITSRGVRWSTKGDPIDDPSAITTNDGAAVGTYQSLLSSLTGNTTYYVRAYATNQHGIAYGELMEFKTLAPQIPVLASPNLIVTAITYTEASGSINILNNGGSVVVSRGLLYSTDRITYLTQESQTDNLTDLGTFISNLKNLIPGTIYYAKGFATNSAGTAYTNEMSFTTPLYLSLITTPASKVTNNSAESGGQIIGLGASEITYTGICWSTSANPTIADDYISGSGSDTFISKIGGLLGSTKYYVRAYAGNNSTIVYGNEESFVTTTSGLAVVTTVEIKNVYSTTAVVKGNVSDNGGSELRSRGMCWNTTGEPTTADQYVAEGKDLGDFLAGINGLEPLTKYYVRAYAVNGVGTAYGDELVFTTTAIPTIATLTTLAATEITGFSANSGGDITSDGGSTITSSGICWSTSALPTIADQRISGSIALGNFMSILTGLKANTTYYIRAFAINEVGTAYGQTEQFTTAPPVLAKVLTKIGQSGAQGITANTGGTITNDGGALITAGGLVWSTSVGFNPDTVSINRITAPAAGSFNITITGLKPGTTYYVRAFAINSVGTAYAANEEQLKTFSLPLVTTSAIEPETITSIGAWVGGNISDHGGTTVYASGVCWSTDRNPLLTNSYTSAEVGMGGFVNKISDLQASTTYYVRAYATNSVGTTYGAEESFTTLPAVIASITTTQAIAINATTASSGGFIESNGGATVTTRGVCWSTEANFNPDTVTVNKTVENGAFIGSFNAQLNGLKEYTVYYVRAYATNSAGTAYGNLVSFVTPQLATISTLYTSAIGSTSALSGGDISDEGGSAVYARGVVWSSDADFNPDTAIVNRTSNGSRDGVFTSPLTKLKPSTTYYVRAYATNVAGTSYGNLLSFTTNPPVLATLTTKDAVGITGSTAQAGGIITDNGGVEVTTRGLVWSTSPGFRPDTVINNKTTNAGLGIGSFNSTVTNLLPGTTYYIRAYVINSVGIAYGNELSFTTLIIPTLTTTEVSISSLGISANSGGTIISDGGATITNQGVVWSTNPNPLLDLAMQTTNDPVTAYTFRSILKDLEPATLYYVKAYAINNQGTAYGNELIFTTPAILPTLTTAYITASSKSSATTGGDISNDGGAAITARGVIWSKDRNFNPDTVTINKTQDGIGIGTFISEVTNLTLSTTYYVRAYAVNSVGTAYGNQVDITLFPTAPLIKTTEVTDLGGFSANAGGEITSDGGADVTLKGLCWSTLSNPTINDSKSSNGAGMDVFTAAMTNLTPNTLYYVRAYAVNKIGVAYGIERSFITDGFPILTVTTAVTNVLATIATSGGEITNDGRTPILTRGVTWNTTGNPTITLDSKTVDDTTPGIGTFIAQLTGLNENTTYYVRAYATNAVGTTYGSQILFTTQEVSLPMISTNSPSLIGSRFATSGGDIIYDGGMPVTQRGICWSTSPEPTTDLLTKVIHETGGIGNFELPFSGLISGTKYYVRAYATNSKGTAYGQEEVFTTLNELPVVTIVTMSNMTQVSAKGTATVSSDGGAVVTTRGLVWNTTGNPTIENGTLMPNGSGTGSFEDTIIGLEEGPTYYVRAYATNEIGTAYGSAETSFKICPETFTVSHVQGLNGSPVTKTVTYGSISSDISGAARCWITQNLGADRQATSVNDATEESAGWYWQFNNPQGYKVSGGTRSPNTTWAPVISEDSEWIAANDPCNLLLGAGWRLPTYTEWSTALTGSRAWKNDVEAYDSELKLHNSAILMSSYGNLDRVGIEGYYWSSTADGPTRGWNAYFYRGLAWFVGIEKSYGTSVRCLRDNIVLTAPFVSNVTISGTHGTAFVTQDGGAAVTERGLVWNTTGNPTIADHVLENGTGVGTFTNEMEGLIEGPTYYVSAYAINKIGISYSPVVTSFKICPETFTVNHVQGLNGAPVTKTVTYKSVSSDVSGTAKCWITQNLGADHQATSAYDATEESAGWYWQFNKLQGYKVDEAAKRTPGMGWNGNISEVSDWLPENDPCVQLLGGGWRLPSGTELTKAVGAPQNWGSIQDGYNSTLKFHAAGYIDNTGVFVYRGVYGYAWSSTAANATQGSALCFSTVTGVTAQNKGYGWTARCLRDEITKTAPSVSDVIVPAETIKDGIAEAQAVVARDGGDPVTAKGLVWNTTGNPTLMDYVIPSGSGIGAISGVLAGLEEGPTYYVRAYATNAQGTNFSRVETSFKVCPPTFTVAHTAGYNGAPVSKTVTYKSVSSNISGAARCWITQNLGADREAISTLDMTETSAGWYWQFNRLQGFKSDGVTLEPGYGAWIASINENTNWLPSNDPCVQLLSGGWRLPTNTEWSNAIGYPQNWANIYDAYNSVLKLHAAGILYGGGLIRLGTEGYFWSSTQGGTSNTAGNLYLTTVSSIMTPIDKFYGSSVRCLRDQVIKTLPAVGDVVVPFATIRDGNAQAQAIVTNDGGAAVTAKGLVWNTTGNPTMADNVISSASGIGEIAGTLTGLKEELTYYIRAFAVNSQGINYSIHETSFSNNACPATFTVVHTAGVNGAPVSKTVTYNTVLTDISGAPKCWITQNLGADHPATSANDATEPSGGWYWQFNRLQGYKTDRITRTPATAWSGVNENSSWIKGNDPCSQLLGEGWRLPTSTELINVKANPQNWVNSTDAYNSVLKLHNAGYFNMTGQFGDAGISGYYWSSTQNDPINGWTLYFTNSVNAVAPLGKSYAWSARCLNDQVKTTPFVSDVVIPIATIKAGSAEAQAAVTHDGGGSVIAKGLVWNTTGNPTLNDQVILSGSGMGPIEGTLTGLNEEFNYYVKAFATNSQGTGYSAKEVRFDTKACPALFTVSHIAGVNGAPVSKTVTYKTVITDISGTPKCWITQNLGADRQATSANDATEASAGWYWQFNRLQGYKMEGTIRTPAMPWGGVYDNSDWLPVNDPCLLLLGDGWRLPTGTELSKVWTNPNNWKNGTDAFNSVLKLHAAGFFDIGGSFYDRGISGYYWAGTQSDAISAWTLYFTNTVSAVAPLQKSYVWSARCLNDNFKVPKE